jgi:hypothetical protein
MDSKSNNSLSGSGARIRRPRPPPRTSSGGGDDLDRSEDFSSMVRKERPKRTLSAELESSLVLGDNNWKNLDTVHQNKFDFDDSELMEDSFAGSSFASTADSCADGEDLTRRFTQLDEEPAAASSPGNPLTARKAPPRRTYSKQSKRMPKKVDPLSAISEDETSDAEE